jgi:guanylate kinase
MSQQIVENQNRAVLVIVSAPSGTGKTTLCERLLGEYTQVKYSISCTTRAPRGKEKDGENYYFLSDEQFVQRIEAGDFLEHALVHGNRYGTLRKTVTDALDAGQSVLMDIDVQGAEQIRNTISNLSETSALKRAFLDVFIEPPSLEALRERLTSRAEDAPEEIEKRLKQASAEMACREAYLYRIVNDTLEQAYCDFRDTILAAMEST